MSITLTITDIDEPIYSRLTRRARANGRSLEEEARDLLAFVLRAEAPRSGNIAVGIHELFAPFGGVDLDIPPRSEFPREPPFDWCSSSTPTSSPSL